MFQKLSQILRKKFRREDELSKQVRIARTLECYRLEVERVAPLAHITPVSLKEKTLTVKVENATQANELRYREPELIRAVNRTIGGDVVGRVVYRF